MTEAERACLVFLAARSGVRDVHASAEDRAHVEGALKRLGADLPPVPPAAVAQAAAQAAPNGAEAHALSHAHAQAHSQPREWPPR
jgi:hypothetical protein